MLLPLAAGALPPFLPQLVALLVASVAIAYVCYRLRLAPIVGFLLAGVLIGPKALGLVRDEAIVAQMAEVGVMLLLFSIGVEFDLARLARLGRSIVVGGGLQVGLTLGAVTLLLVAFGVGLNDALFTGGLVALSSTAIVLSLLSERGETDTPRGQTSLAVLLFQDFAVIAMVLLLPLLGGGEATLGETLLGLGKAVLVVAAVAVAARRIVPPFLSRVAATGRAELFLMTVVALCFGTAALVAAAGVSVALGAFLAGLVVSESQHSEQALADVTPLRIIFNAGFFVSVGMLLDVWFVVENPLLVLGLAAAVLLLKVVVTGASVAVLGLPVRVMVPVALAVAQIGEFSFVLAQAGADFGLHPGGIEGLGDQAFIAVSVVLMTLTPLFVSAGPKLGERLADTRLGRLGHEPPAASNAPLADHVVLIGYGPSGQRLARVLREEELPFTVVEMNPHLHARAAEESGAAHAIWGDAAQRMILEAAGVPVARLVCVAVNDPAATRRTVAQARALAPAAQIVVRTRHHVDIEDLRRAGADVVVPEELETTMRLVSHVLGAYLVPHPVIEDHIRALRGADYRILRGSIQEAHLMVLQALDDEGLHTRAVLVAPDSPADGQTLAELQLRRRFDLHVLLVRRADGHSLHGPGGDIPLQGGDRLVLVGPPPKFAEVAPLFRVAETSAEA
jgi:monovalent cation:H+ antiporter-2, CPA2 family